jgi:acyl-CoA synthetase (AMP-forming)/AMP-acid ligase II
MTTVLDIVIATFPPLISGRDVMLGILPCYHIYGADYSLLKTRPLMRFPGTAKLLHFPFLRGVPVVFQQRFDPDQFCAAVQKYKITACLVAPPVLVVLAKHPGWFAYFCRRSVDAARSSGRPTRSLELDASVLWRRTPWVGFGEVGGFTLVPKPKILPMNG